MPLIRPLLPTFARLGSRHRLGTWGAWCMVVLAFALMGVGESRGQESASPSGAVKVASEGAQGAAEAPTPEAEEPDAEEPDAKEAKESPEPEASARATPAPARDATTPSTASTPSAPNTQRPVSPIYSDLSGRIEVVGPDTFLLIDSEGNPQPVLNMSYEEFLRLMQLEQGVGEPGAGARRQYTLERLDIEGSLKPGYSEFTATMEITLHTAETVEVPLRFEASILRKQPDPPPRADGRFLSFADEERGWIATLQGQPGEKVTLSLDFIAPIERNGDRFTLRLRTPRASVGELRLESPATIESDGVLASGGVVVEALPMGEEGADGTRIEAIGLGGEFRLSWEEQQEEAVNETATVLSSVGQLRYQIDANNVQTEARLEVSSLGAQFDTFRIRLPEGAEYIRHEDRTVDQSGAVVRMIKSVERELHDPEAGGGQVYVVKLNAETRGPVVLQLETNHQLAREGEKGRVRLQGFEVLGAVRQDGKIVLGVDSQLQLSFAAENLQQVDLSEVVAAGATTSPGEELTAALRYFSLPWAVNIEVAKRERRVTATTEYELEIDEDQILLDMTVVYEITGLGKRDSRVSFPLTFDLREWQLTNRRVETQGLEDAAEAVPSESLDGDNGANILRYPYATATTDRAPRIVLHLRRDLADGESFTTALPFVADPFAMGTSKVKVNVAPGLLFTPANEAIEGLAPLPLDDTMVLAPGTTPGQQFEYRGFLPEPVFAGSLKQRPQRITSNVETRIALVGQQAHVEQTIHLDIRHQPLEELSLVIPSDVLRDENLEVAWVRPELAGTVQGDAQSDKVRLELPLAADGPTTSVPELHIPLARPQMGKLDVVVSYQLDVPPTTTEATWVVPLVTPLATELSRQTVVVEAGEDHVLSPVGGSEWRVDSSDTSSPGDMRFSCTKALNYLPLARRRLPRAAGVTDIERMWLQTWLTEGIVQQRLAIAFRSNKSEEVIELPEGVDPMDVEVFLDGVQVDDAKPSAAQLVVPLAGSSGFSMRTLELRYRQPYRFAWIDSLKVEVPRLASGNESLAEMYWQVVAPTRHLPLQTPEGCVNAYVARWSEGDWRAEGDRSTQELESWVNGVLRERPTMAEHTLLWRGDPRRATLEVWLVRRELIVLACSAVVLGVVLTLVYLPVMRRRGVWLTLAVGVAALGIMYPNAARVVAQGGLLGGFAAMVALALAAVSRRAEPDSTASTPAMGSTIVPAASRGSSIAPLGGTGTLSTNAPTISIEMSDAPS